MLDTAIRPEPASPATWHALARQLRVDAVRLAAIAGSGHPTSAMSAADLMAVLLEDHWAEGGLGDAVLAALADHDVHVPTRRLAVRRMPTSGAPTELLRWAGIDRGAIQGAVQDLITEEARA